MGRVVPATDSYYYGENGNDGLHTRLFLERKSQFFAAELSLSYTEPIA
jgi:hypothetical protein